MILEASSNGGDDGTGTGNASIIVRIVKYCQKVLKISKFMLDV